MLHYVVGEEEDLQSENEAHAHVNGDIYSYYNFAGLDTSTPVGKERGNEGETKIRKFVQHAIK